MPELVLHLRPDEKEKFDALSDELKDGWKVEEEKLMHDDTPKKRSMRILLLRIRDQKLQSFVEEAKKENDASKLASLVHDTDLSDVNDADIAELFFALGPEALSKIIMAMIGDIGSDEDIEGVAAITIIRNSLLTSMQPA